MVRIRPLTFEGIGEALYDAFEGGAETLGGDPMNFAVHAYQARVKINKLYDNRLRDKAVDNCFHTIY